MNKKHGTIRVVWILCFVMILLVVWGGKIIVFKKFNFKNQSQNITSKVYKKNNPSNYIVNFSSTTTQKVVPSENISSNPITNKDIQNIIDPANVPNPNNYIDIPSPIKSIDTPNPVNIPTKNLIQETDILSDSGIIFYTNLARKKRGLPTLTQNTLLTQAAIKKLNHMFVQQYFAHIAPSGEDVSYWTESVDYDYLIIGENLALGSFKNNKEIVTAWMNSPKHRANILKKEYLDIGVAVQQGQFEGNTVWISVQVFAAAMKECPTIDIVLEQKIETHRMLLHETQKTFEQMELVISEEQIVAPEEYTVYMNLIERYNEFVAIYNTLATELQSMIDNYNNQVKVFNECILEKQ